jgi:hypothetical protein
MGRTLAGSIESRVRPPESFLSIIEQNTPQIFEQFETSSSEKIFT